MANPYDGFDAVICISLEGASEREQNMKQIAAVTGAPIEFYRARRHALGGRHGCFHSHVQVARLAYERGCENVLIFEDDVRLSPGYDPEIIRHAADFARGKTGWNMLQLGYSTLRHNTDILGPVHFMFAEKETPHIVRHGSMLCHAYCLSRPAMRTMILAGGAHLAQPGGATAQVDAFILQIFKGGYFAVTPLQFDQKWCSASYNDSATFVERFFRANQCDAETWDLFYHLSMLPGVRRWVEGALLLLSTALAVLIVILVHYYSARSARSVRSSKKRIRT
ncbi:hypothetical protein TSOC_012509 [Tetrabaena socialis]|uniref:Glycosyl transferase family 25 domain-containing protein n=1 Tax=Tetrabaena socialis TaxID=47790 RepID=A0A2J7ZMT8_9CHLO|nr:hypothetical protein TSOC_012509 [Tetrabaena socialis]|eukprot:PNH01585.1 hypothetical protein TSOC_012509 [Tetrabaena socialis]